MALLVKHRFSETNKCGMVFDKTKNKVQQQFAKEADINNIMLRYKRTGILVDPLIAASRTPIFGNFASVADYHSMQNTVIKAQELFMDLPVEIRKRFKHDVAELMDFLGKSENYEEAVKLGLVKDFKAKEMPGGTPQKPVDSPNPKPNEIKDAPKANV